MAEDRKSVSRAKSDEQEAQAKNEDKLSPSAGESMENRDVTDETANQVLHPADIGTSLTSHGDGTATIAPQLVERRKELAEFNEDPDRENRALARQMGLIKE